MESRQLILATESNRASKIDYIYIRSFIEQYFIVDQNVKIAPVYMNGKGNFDNRAVEKKIEKTVKEYINGDSIVIYCYDTDDINRDPYHKEFDKRINDYCQRNKYQLVYFCRDIEEVFIGQRINKNVKKETVEKFLRCGNIEKVDLKRFMSFEKKEKSSNLYNVLDCLLVAKKK